MIASMKLPNGLEIAVAFVIQPAEYENNIPHAYVEEWEVVEVMGECIKRKLSNWLYDRIIKEGYGEQVNEACLKEFNNQERECW